MLPFLAALPAIFSAVSKVTDLFDKGKEVAGAVRGRSSEASTPQELESEIRELPPAQQDQWAKAMQAEVSKFKAQNERLAVEIGIVDTNITEEVSTKAADTIALMRMTTRPWTVRWMVHYVLFPFYLVTLDVVQQLLLAWLPFLSTLGIREFKAFDYVFGSIGAEVQDPGFWEKFAGIAEKGLVGKTMAAQLYMESIAWVVSIIVAYMGLREIGKARGTADGTPHKAAGEGALAAGAKVLGQGLGLVEKIRKAFK
jgi:hypothetical protein